MSAPTTNENERQPAKGDLVMTYPLNSLEPQLSLVHYVQTDDTTSGFTRVYGVNLQSIIDFRDPATDGPEGLIEWFRITPNPDDALMGLRKTIFEPILTMADALPLKVSEIHINDDEFRLPSSGAVRKHLLGYCPFPCVRGIVMSYYKFTQKWSDILPAHGEAAKEFGVPATETTTFASVVNADEQTATILPGGIACPGCLGYDLAKEHIALKLEQISTLRLEMSEETLKKIVQLNEKIDAFKVKVDGAQELCGYFDNDHPSAGQMLDKEDANTEAEALPVFSYEFLEAAKERVLDDKTCAICRFVKYEKGAAITGLPCKHFFHRDCLEPWLDEVGDCPLCRKKVTGYLNKYVKEWPSLPTAEDGAEGLW